MRQGHATGTPGREASIPLCFSSILHLKLTQPVPCLRLVMSSLSGLSFPWGSGELHRNLWRMLQTLDSLKAEFLCCSQPPPSLTPSQALQWPRCPLCRTQETESSKVKGKDRQRVQQVPHSRAHGFLRVLWLIHVVCFQSLSWITFLEKMPGTRPTSQGGMPLGQDLGTISSSGFKDEAPRS